MSSEIYSRNGYYEDSLKQIIDGFLKLEQVTDEHFLAAHLQLVMLENVAKKHRAKLYEVKDDTYIKIEGIPGWFYIGNRNALGAVNVIQELGANVYAMLINKKLNEEIEWPGDSGKIEKIKRKINIITTIEDYIAFKGAEIIAERAQQSFQFVKMVQVGSDIETMKKSFLNFMSKENEYFDLYGKGQLPLSLLATYLGNVGNMFSKFRFEQKYFINIINNDDEIRKQKEIARRAIDGVTVLIDGTSLFLLFESGIYEKALDCLPNFCVPASALNEYRNLIDKFSLIPKDGLLQMGQAKGDIRGTILFKEYAEKFKNHIVSFIDFVYDTAKDIIGISEKEKSDEMIEQKILPSVSDACIIAQKNKSDIVMTEDPSYIYFNSKMTKKRVPESFSLWALIKVLYEVGKITWEDYLETFYWLTIYRERFLPTNANDIEKCLLGDRQIKVISLQNIDKLNLELVWSDAYGTTINSVINVASDFLTRVIKDNSIIEEQLEKIYPRIFIPVLKNRDGHFWANVLVKSCELKLKSALLLINVSENVERRLMKLRELVREYLKRGKFQIL